MGPSCFAFTSRLMGETIIGFPRCQNGILPAGTGVGARRVRPACASTLLAGRLVAPFPITAQTHETWFLQYRPVRQEEPVLQAFRGWLQGEAERQRQIESSLLKEPGGMRAGMV